MMTTPQNSHNATTLARYADGELSQAEAAEFEAALNVDAELSEALEALREQSAAHAAAFEDALAQTDLSAALDPLHSAIAAGPAECPSSLLMAAADGEPLTAEQRDLVLRARLHDEQALETIPVFQHHAQLHQDSISHELSSLDLDGLADRVLALAAAEDAAENTAEAPSREGTPAEPGVIAKLMGLFRPATLGLVAMILLGLVTINIARQPSSDPADQPKRFEIPAPQASSARAIQDSARAAVAVVDNLHVDPGYEGEVVPGTDELAPVVWIKVKPGQVQ